MKRWCTLGLLTTALAVTAGCGEQSPTSGADGGAGQTLAAEPGHEGHNHGPGEGHGAPAASGGEESGGFPGDGPWAKAPEAKYKTSDTGLTYAVIKEGKGDGIAAGKMAVMHYTGWLKDGGKKFDSSRDRGQPFPFPLGGGQVIPGWDEGVAGMKVGEQRQLVIPAKLGYGDNGAPPDIPPGATLVFDVELMKIEG